MRNRIRLSSPSPGVDQNAEMVEVIELLAWFVGTQGIDVKKVTEQFWPPPAPCGPNPQLPSCRELAVELAEKMRRQENLSKRSHEKHRLFLT